jgi:GR25 family glycosyltransferase involved in LPS biosynthesis
MKTFILYNSSNPKSVENALLCLKSFKKFSSWMPELYDGYTPTDLNFLNEKYKLKDDRARYPPSEILHKSKKACFYSHFSLWLKCIELNTPIAIVEHDTYCNGNLPKNFTFDGVVQFSAESMFNYYYYYTSSHANYIESYHIYKTLNEGLHSVNKFPPVPNWGYCIAGNTAYGIMPSAAKILVEDCFEYGWQQNDLLMSTKLCKVEITVPSPIVYDPSRELKTSSTPIK